MASLQEQVQAVDGFIEYKCTTYMCSVNAAQPHQSCKVRKSNPSERDGWTATAGTDVVQSGLPIFDDFFQHLWPYIGNNTANIVFQMVKRLWLIRIDQ
ncbi:hypothetical protein TNCV_4466381 [Trichonephila clavipes]|nr:hypothetical protein TNCV_4466381 [Trichonephila clavipes]